MSLPVDPSFEWSEHCEVVKWRIIGLDTKARPCALIFFTLIVPYVHFCSSLNCTLQSLPMDNRNSSLLKEGPY
jgi:hypothetical protein